MDVGSFFKKFAEISARVAPLVLIALGLPPVVASAITQGITVAQTIAGATNTEKAAKAATIAQASIEAMNAIAMQHGGGPLVDETVSADALAQAVKMTYDITKMVHTANGDPMPAAAPTP